MKKTFGTLAFLTLSTPAAFAQNGAESESAPGDRDVDEVVVYGRAQELIGRAQSASEGIVGYDDIRLPPMLRVGELVEAVPGMVATQHSGTGKANQYFIRGFNLDHGTDFAVSVEGVPINMRSHGHGQGYLDLNFLIPEMVETTRYRRGPYSAAVGDFSSAASLSFDLYDRLPETILSASVGEFGYYRALAAGSFDTAGGTLSGALDLTSYDGPWKLDEDLRQTRFFVGYGLDLGDAKARLTLQGYDSEWNSTDQIPARAVESGQIGLRGFIDPDLGGETSRFALTGSLDFGVWQLNAYAIDYDFTLYSNFTYFLDDPVDGDEFEQRDNRRVYGLAVNGASNRYSDTMGLVLRWGGDLRFDDIDDVGLFGTVARVRNDVIRQDQIEELSISAWSEAELAFTDRLRAVLGARADFYDWDVTAVRPENSGRGDDTLISPKAALAYRFNDGVEAYLNWGRGFHSNDVRGATIAIDPASGDPADPVDALVRSDGAEIGLRLERGDSFNATLVGFWLELDSELVFVGDAGATEANDATERFGLEATVFWQTNDWLAINAAYTTTDTTFKIDRGDGRKVPGAVESTFTLGMNAAWENGLTASTRLRWLSEAPLVEDNSVRSEDSLLINAGAGYRAGMLEYRLDILNLLNSGDNDISYSYASRLPGEPDGGIEDIHFHPLEPRTVRASVVLHLN